MVFSLNAKWIKTVTEVFPNLSLLTQVKMKSWDESSHEQSVSVHSYPLSKGIVQSFILNGHGNNQTIQQFTLNKI
jgi:hypothetical protein